MFRFRSRIFILALAAIFILVPHSQAQNQSSPPTQQTQGTHQEEYHESALRRFEIITLSALPFTAVHSYLGVRGVKMIQTNKIAPELTSQNYRVMGICAVSFSLFIGIWDWLHTRNVDRSAPSVPGYKPPTRPTDEAAPPDGSIARGTFFGPHANVYGISTNFGQQGRYTVNTQLNMWSTEPPVGLVIPLFEIRF
ncbi:MAG: hypothetical protein OXI67_04070 [Candidatus Poribacteria bacterium]|nr:hypothetical protein [Candidatus Poribacteria bacterium]